jgi:hypothetical protein
LKTSEALNVEEPISIEPNVAQFEAAVSGLAAHA